MGIIWSTRLNGLVWFPVAAGGSVWRISGTGRSNLVQMEVRGMQGEGGGNQLW